MINSCTRGELTLSKKYIRNRTGVGSSFYHVALELVPYMFWRRLLYSSGESLCFGAGSSEVPEWIHRIPELVQGLPEYIYLRFGAGPSRSDGVSLRSELVRWVLEWIYRAPENIHYVPRQVHSVPEYIHYVLEPVH